MGGNLVYVFIPEDDSVVIGNERYILSVINLGAIGENPNSLPYPPSYWPQFRYWQFANRHNPYLATQYTGEDETARLEQAALDTVSIGLGETLSQEPLQMYLDTNSQEMIVWPIYAFPYATSMQIVDTGQFKTLTTTILGLLSTLFPTQTVPTAAQLGEQILLPSSLSRNNPYTYGITANVNPGGGSPITLNIATAPETNGQVVTNLNPNAVRTSNGATNATTTAMAKATQASRDVVQARVEKTASNKTTDTRRLQPIYGFSVYNPATGEAYIIEVVDNDLVPPDQLPDATENTTYDPYYVRVVFLNTLTCYNMSIIVPSIARDQYGYLGKPETKYANLLSKIDDYDLGYMYQLADAGGGFDELYFIPESGDKPPAGENYLYTNIPYALRSSGDRPEVQASFLCRRRNWDAECLLMEAKRKEGANAYLAFGAGDLIPLRLDNGVDIDKRQPQHMVEFSYGISDNNYESVQTFTTGNVPYFVGVTTWGGSLQYTAFSIGQAALTPGINLNRPTQLQFPPNIYAVGEATTSFTTVADLNLSGPDTTDTGAFVNQDPYGNYLTQQFQIVTYNNLVYLIRAVTNCAPLAQVGNANAVSGLLIDTFVPTPAGNLVLAQGARYKRSGLQYFGSTYTPTTMVDTLDNLDFTSITGKPSTRRRSSFRSPSSTARPASSPTSRTSSVRSCGRSSIPRSSRNRRDCQRRRVPERLQHRPGRQADPVLAEAALRLRSDGRALHPERPHPQVRAAAEATGARAHQWPSSRRHLLALRQPAVRPPATAQRLRQQILPSGWGMDRTNIIYSSYNRPVHTTSDQYMGMSINSFQLRCTTSKSPHAERPDGLGLHLRGLLGPEHADRCPLRLRQQRPRHARPL